MVEKNQIYRCNVCGNMIEVVIVGGGSLTCCGKKMELLKENDTDAAVEKHVPVVKKSEGKVSVVVGSVEHPMVDSHYIQFIELVTPSKVLRAHLNPGEAPKAVFEIDEKIVKVREYCNLHGLWVS